MKNILLAVILAASPVAAQEFAAEMPAMNDILAKTHELKTASALAPKQPSNAFRGPAQQALDKIENLVKSMERTQDPHRIKELNAQRIALSENAGRLIDANLDASSAQPAAATAQEGDTLASLKKAKSELEGSIATLNAMIAVETNDAKKLALYKLKDQTQRTLNEVSASLDRLVKEGGSNAQDAKLDTIMAEAKILNKLLASYLGMPDFAGTFHMKEQPFELEIKADAIYAGVLKKLPFLGGAIQGHVRINPGAEMVSQFNSLKAEYYMTLLDAAQVLKNAGKDPMDDRRLKGMAEWGRNMKVIAPGNGWMGATEILTWDQYNSLAR
jgi:hypothetical protein